MKVTLVFAMLAAVVAVTCAQYGNSYGGYDTNNNRGYGSGNGYNGYRNNNGPYNNNNQGYGGYNPSPQPYNYNNGQQGGYGTYTGGNPQPTFTGGYGRK